MPARLYSLAAIGLAVLACTACGRLGMLEPSDLAAPPPQAQRGNDELKKYCTGDYLTYCGEYNPDDPRLDQCFKTNWKKISENCRRAIDAFTPPETPSTPAARKRG